MAPPVTVSAIVGQLMPLNSDLNLAYQIFTRFSGAIYIASPGFTSYVV